MQIVLIFILCLSLSVMALDENQVSEDVTSISSQSESLMGFRPFIMGQTFSNDVFKMNGQIYSIGFQIYDIKEFMFTLQVPYIIGNKNDQAIEEIGNIKPSIELNLFEDHFFSWWVMPSAALSQPKAEIANRFDSYRLGQEFRMRYSYLFSDFGIGYTSRNNEMDPKLNVGDMMDVNFRFGFKILRKISLGANTQWIKTLPLVYDKNLILSRNSEWIGVTPEISILLGAGLGLTLGATFPVFLSRTPEEIQTGFMDQSLPQPGLVTLKSSLSARF